MAPVPWGNLARPPVGRWLPCTCLFLSALRLTGIRKTNDPSGIRRGAGPRGCGDLLCADPPHTASRAPRAGRLHGLSSVLPDDMRCLGSASRCHREGQSAP